MIKKKSILMLILLLVILFSGCNNGTIQISDPIPINITNSEINNNYYGNLSLNYENLLTVAKNDTGLTSADFTSIQDAINSITDNNLTNRYLIRIMPGIYEENIVLKDYVFIDGQTLGSVIIKGSGVLYTLPSTISYTKNIRFELIPTSDNDVIVQGLTGGNHEFFINEFEIISNISGITARVFNINANSLTTSDSGIDYIMTGNATGTLLHDVVNIQGSTDYTLLRHSIRCIINDTDDNIAFINDVSNGTTILSQVDILGQQTNPNFSGIFAGLAHYGAGALKVDALVLINIIGSGSGTAYSFYVDSTTNNAEVEAAYGLYNTIGFGNNYFIYLGVGDEFNSLFNTITETNGSIIFGDYNYINHNNGLETTASNMDHSFNSSVQIFNITTGSNNGTNLCIDSNNKICQCGACA